MTQTWAAIPATGLSVKDSRQRILDRYDTLRSHQSGTAFPTTDLFVGMTCYRTDQEKLHQLRSTGPSVWVLIADLTDTYLSQELGDARYSVLAHTHTAADVGAVPTARTITASTGLTGGGDLSANRSLAIATDGVTNALLDNMPANTAKANITGGSANPTDVTKTDFRTWLGTDGVSLHVFHEAPANKDFVLIYKSPIAFTINTLNVKVASGSCTMAIKINGASVTGMSATAVTSSDNPETATAANTVAAGDTITMTISSGSSPVDLQMSLKGTRT